MAPLAFELLTNFLPYKQMFVGSDIVPMFTDIETAFGDMKNHITNKDIDAITNCLTIIRQDLTQIVDKMQSENMAFIDDAQMCLDTFNQLTTEDTLA
jgi:hypothetical protein